MTDYQTLQRRRNMVVGGFVLLAFVAFVWMLIKFRNLPLFASQFNSFKVLVDFPDAPGVQKDTPVRYCGYQVGRVALVAPPRLVHDAQDHPRHTVGVTIAIDDRFDDIPSHAQFLIVRRGLGSSFIEIQVDPQKPVTDVLRDEMRLDGAVSTASDFFPPQVQKKLEDLVDSITLLSQNTNAIIGDPDNRLNIKRTLENIVAASTEATDAIKSIRRLADSGTERLDSTADTLDDTLKSFHRLSEVGAEHVELLARNLDDTLKAFRQMLSDVHDGDGTTAKLIHDGRLYENLLDSTRQLELALEQLKFWAADARERGIRIKW